MINIFAFLGILQARVIVMTLCMPHSLKIIISYGVLLSQISSTKKKQAEKNNILKQKNVTFITASLYYMQFNI